MKIVCAAPSCKYSVESEDSSDIIFISFPDDDTSTIWAHNCGRPDLLMKSNEELHMNYYVCSNHIEDHYYLSKTNQIVIAQGAIPTLFRFERTSPEHFTSSKEYYSSSDHVIDSLRLHDCIDTVNTNFPSNFAQNANSNYPTTIYNDQLHSSNNENVNDSNEINFCNININLNQFEGMTIRLKNLCRICGQSIIDGFDIVNERGTELKIKDKIHLHLPILIETDNGDSLPQKMCSDCYEKLDVFHSLVVTCLQTDIKLRKYLHLPFKFNNEDKFREIINTYELEINTEMCPRNPTDEYATIIADKSKDSTTSALQDFNVEINKDSFSQEALDNQSTIQYNENNLSSSSSSSSSTSSSSSSSSSSSLSSSSTKIHNRLKNITHTDLNNLMLQPLQVLKNSNIVEDQSSIALVEKNFNSRTEKHNENVIDITDNSELQNHHNSNQTLPKNNIQVICSVSEQILFQSNKSVGEQKIPYSEKLKIFEDKKCDETFNKYDKSISHDELQSENNISQQNRRCGHCSLAFTNRKKLQSHISETHVGQRILFQCGMCDKIYEKWSSLDVHEATHRQDKPYLCDLCGKSFKHSNNLRGHKRIHLDISKKKRHICEICGNAFRSRFHLREHMNQHNGNKPYICEQCGKAFSKRIQLRQHYLSHGSNKYECPICGITFNRRGNMNTHLKRHNNNIGTYTCSVCMSRCKSMSELKIHRKEHSENDILESIKKKCSDKTVWKCQECTRIFSKRAALISHERTHNSDQMRIECDKCGKKLANKNSLKYHTKSIHTMERPHACQFCEESFVSKEARLIHERIHTGERPYICKLCNMQYRCSSNLSQHMKVHSKIRPYVCQYCNKSFTRKGAMTVHERIHTGIKPFTCDRCDKKFSQKNYMIKHMKTHEVKLFIRCEECNEIFSTKTELYEHFENIHKSNTNNSSIIDSIHVSEK